MGKVRSVAGAGRVALRIGVIWGAVCPVVIGPACGQVAPTAGESVPGTPSSPREGAAVRAYDRSVPRAAEMRTMALTVLEDEDGRPVGDAEVRITHYVGFRTYEFRTDRDGRLRFEYPTLDGEPMVRVEVRKEGYVGLGTGWGFEDGSRLPDAATLRLRRGLLLGGMVVDEAGRPVDDATVLLTVTRLAEGSQAAHPGEEELYREIPARTGADGRWRTGCAPPGSEAVRLRLIHPDFVSDRFPSRGRPVRSPTIAALRGQSDRQVLSPGLTIPARVLDDAGRPVPGLWLDDPMRTLSQDAWPWHRPPDVEGCFPLHLPPGQVLRLVAHAPGYAAVAKDLIPAPDQPAVEFRLPKGKRLRGRVVDQAGRPIEAARVQTLVTMHPNNSTYFLALTDAEGRFEWDEAPAEAVPFHVEALGSLADDVIPLTAGPEKVTIKLKPAVDVRLAAVDAATGQPIPRFRVEIGMRERGTGGFRWRPPMGRTAPRKFRAVLEADEGPYHFRISADGYTPVRILAPSAGIVLRKTMALHRAPR